MARSYRRTFIETAGDLKNMFAHKVFCGWDFSFATNEAAKLKSKSVYNELKVRVPVTCFLSLSLPILAFSSFSPFPHLLLLYFSYLSSLLSLCLHPGAPILIITNDLHQLCTSVTTRTSPAARSLGCHVSFFSHIRTSLYPLLLICFFFQCYHSVFPLLTNAYLCYGFSQLALF